MQGIDIAKAPVRFQPIIKAADTKPQDGFISGTEAIPAATEISKFLGADTTLFKDNDKAMQYLMNVMGVEFVQMPEAETKVISAPEASKEVSEVEDGASKSAVSNTFAFLDNGIYGNSFSIKIGEYTLDYKVDSTRGMNVWDRFFSVSKKGERVSGGVVSSLEFAVADNLSDSLYIIGYGFTGELSICSIPNDNNITVFEILKKVESVLTLGHLDYFLNHIPQYPFSKEEYSELVVKWTELVAEWIDSGKGRLSEKDYTKRLFNSRSAEASKLLIKAGANVNAINSDTWRKTALMIASENGRVDVAKVLIEAGAKVNAKNSSGETALIKAARNGWKEVVKLLIESGAKVNAKCDNGINGNTALHMASLKGWTDVVKILLEAGADVNNYGLIWGVSPLIKAARNGHTEVVSLLIDAGVKQQKIINRALLFTAENGHAEVAKVLIEAGADVNYVEDDYCTPLTEASSNAHVEVAEVLLEAGANVNFKNKDGWTPLTFATFWKSEEQRAKIVPLLKKYGAK